MNALRLVLGWLFLAGFTAAGTYYAMDELDSRVGLARFRLHEKLGIARYAAAPVTPPINNQVPVSNPTQVITPIGQGGQPGNQIPPAQNPPQQVVPPPVVQNPPPPIVTPPQAQPQPIVVTPPPIQIPPRNTTPPAQQQPQRPVYTPQQTVLPPSRPQDYTETNERLIEVKGRAEGVRRVWADTLRNVPSPRAEITGALSAMRRYVQQAEQSLQSGDTASARQYLDQAEKQMEILQKWRE